jgi:hypothetical protein
VIAFFSSSNSDNESTALAVLCDSTFKALTSSSVSPMKAASHLWAALHPSHASSDRAIDAVVTALAKIPTQPAERLSSVVLYAAAMTDIDWSRPSRNAQELARSLAKRMMSVSPSAIRTACSDWRARAGSQMARILTVGASVVVADVKPLITMLEVLAYLLAPEFGPRAPEAAIEILETGLEAGASEARMSAEELAKLLQQFNTDAGFALAVRLAADMRGALQSGSNPSREI